MPATKSVPKGCWTCGGPKPDGRGRHYCQDCQMTQKEAQNKRMRTYKDRHPDRKLVIYARSSAQDKGLECDLRFGDLSIPPICPVLGIPLFFTPGKRTANTPTADRVDSKRGYTKDNVVVVSWRANDLKKDATIAELVKLAQFYQQGGPSDARNS